MSSNTYSSNLKPDPKLRIHVLNSGRVLLAAGLLLILVQDIPVLIRAAVGLTWFVTGSLELRRIARGFDALSAIRVFPDGAVEILAADGSSSSGRCAPGCIVLSKLAWLRLQSDDGRQFVELLRCRSCESLEWRRLQVIWRFIGTQQ